MTTATHEMHLRSEPLAPGAPILLCATRAEAAPLLSHMSLKTRIPGTKLYLVWGKLSGREPFIVGVSGMGGARATRMTRFVVENLQPSCLVWFGVAGGLTAGFEVGDLIIPARIIPHGIRLSRDAYAATAYSPTKDLQERILAVTKRHAVPVSDGMLVEVNRVVGSVREKTALGHDTGAVACDMESGSFAEAASHTNHPWAVIRSIFDRVEDELPPVPDNILDDTGAVRPFVAAREFFKAPKALWEMGRRNQKALGVLGPVLGLVVREVWE